MSTWAPEHASRVLTAYEVLREAPTDASPADVLYRDWYAVRPPRSAPPDRWAAPVAGTARAAHAGSARWSREDTEVVATGIAGIVVVVTPTGRRALCRGEYVTTRGRPGFPPRTGDRVRVLDRPGSVIQEGWWRTWGGRWDPSTVPAGLVRVYLRPAAGAVGRLVRAATSVLDPDGWWMLKVAASAEQLDRPDAVVLYLAGPRRHRLRSAVAEAVAGLTTGEPPALTARLGEGIGWAEDPGTGASFGEVRCAAVATAYARLAGAAVEAETWLDLVADELRSTGVDPAAPHRGERTTGSAS
ncbi:T3SS effector HopA1 family protein [Rothia sp. ARF10]|nr:T3SS effector HopA1 family protein [Rothia sp. ARF10]